MQGEIGYHVKAAAYFYTLAKESRGEILINSDKHQEQ